mmetsp:Transcript_37129/g.104764  ORF Transcript_37129/g.104764 Transcript_37129/m.104764 type:complete len:201 (+) Transcript_37129:214-816(+)
MVGSLIFLEGLPSSSSTLVTRLPSTVEPTRANFFASFFMTSMCCFMVAWETAAAPSSLVSFTRFTWTSSVRIFLTSSSCSSSHSRVPHSAPSTSSFTSVECGSRPCRAADRGWHDASPAPSRQILSTCFVGILYFWPMTSDHVSGCEMPKDSPSMASGASYASLMAMGVGSVYSCCACPTWASPSLGAAATLGIACLQNE